jgi:hypothetical protein
MDNSTIDNGAIVGILSPWACTIGVEPCMMTLCDYHNRYARCSVGSIALWILGIRLRKINCVAGLADEGILNVEHGFVLRLRDAVAVDQNVFWQGAIVVFLP